MKRLVMVVALTCALSVQAMAGDIHSTDFASPGEIPTGGAPQQTSNAISLWVLSTVLGLLAC
jgi:hypothetical protein